jgi:X-Pro dipeptidyl-peptidase
VPGDVYDFSFPLLPEDYVFETGHQIAVILVGSYPSYSSLADQTRANITVSGRFSKILLPIVGGEKAALAAGF